MDEPTRNSPKDPSFSSRVLAGKVIVTTGGTQGVGEAIALRAAHAGAAGVVLCGRQRERGEEVAAEVERCGSHALYVPLDLADPDNCRQVIAACDQHFGRLDGLVNAAASTQRATIDELTVELWDYQFAVNVRGPALLIQEATRLMRRNQIAGSIVNIASVVSYCGGENLVAYSASKGAMVTLTKNVAQSMRRHRIRVNAINLGWTDTPAEHAVQLLEGKSADWLSEAEQRSPFGRLIKPDDVARFCLFLLSDESGTLTGSVIDYAQRVMGYVPPGTE